MDKFEPKQPKEPRPVLLTKAEALTYAAERLERMAVDTDLAGMIVGILKESPPADLDDKTAADLARITAELREPELQAKAMREAAKAIREMAIEERLVSARVTAATVAA